MSGAADTVAAIGASAAAAAQAAPGTAIRWGSVTAGIVAVLAFMYLSFTSPEARAKQSVGVAPNDPTIVAIHVRLSAAEAAASTAAAAASSAAAAASQAATSAATVSTALAADMAQVRIDVAVIKAVVDRIEKSKER